MKEFNEVYQQWFDEVYMKKHPDLIDTTQYFYELGQKESKKQYESMGVALVTENNEVFYDDLKRICSSAFKPGDRVDIYIKKKEPLSFV